MRRNLTNFRVLHFAEEGQTDRHNMLVFLLNETRGKNPIGYEEEQRNIFDPVDDENKTAKLDEVGANGSNDTESHREMNYKCHRKGCTDKHRFDSLFCSDACGVSSLESDLLRTFKYSTDMHPSSLRH